MHTLDALISQRRIERDRIRVRLEHASNQRLKEILIDCRGMGIDSVTTINDIRHGKIKASVINFISEEARRILNNRAENVDRE